MEDKLLKKLAEEHETPLYVYDGYLIEQRCKEFREAFADFPVEVKCCYALKANTNLAILSLIKNQGFGADVVSTGELDACMKVGFNPADVIYNSNSKSESEIKAALDAGINLTVGNTTEIGLLKKFGGKKIAFRVNPDVQANTHAKISTALHDSKFGLHFEDDIAYNAVKKARDIGLKVSGIQCHIGSNIKDASAFTDTGKKMMQFASRLKEELDITLDFIDFGGGLGVPYNNEKALKPGGFATAYKKPIEEGLDKLGYKPECWFEPGRFIVAEAGVLLTKVNSVKKTPAKKFVNVDSGFNTLLRPAMYDAYHQVHVVGKKGVEETYDIAGSLCESSDILAKERKLPKIDEGDVIAIHNAGAYGFSMASAYNSKPLPAEVLVRRDRVDVIRERSGIEDLYWKQKIPSDLE